MYQFPIVSRLVHPYAPLVILLGLAIVRLWWKGKLSRLQQIVITVPYLPNLRHRSHQIIQIAMLLK